MISYLRSLPFGVWAGAVILGLGIWAKDVLGVALGGIVAVVTLIATDRAAEAASKGEPDGDAYEDDRSQDI